MSHWSYWSYWSHWSCSSCQSYLPPLIFKRVHNPIALEKWSPHGCSVGLGIAICDSSIHNHAAFLSP